MPNYTNLSSLFTAIANAIRGKTGGTAQIVADNFPSAIAAITTDPSVNDTLTDGKYMLSPYTAHSKGVQITGSMTDRGAVSQALNAGGSYTVPAGYHNGSGKVTANSLASQTAGTAAAGDIYTGKTAWVGGTQITGSMTNRGAVSQALNAGGSYTVPAGYHNGSGKVTANSLASQTSATATAAQILSGYTAWVNGSKLTGTAASYVMGEVTTTNAKTLTIAAAAGKANIILILWPASAPSSTSSSTLTAEPVIVGWVDTYKFTMLGNGNNKMSLYGTSGAYSNTLSYDSTTGTITRGKAFTANMKYRYIAW